MSALLRAARRRIAGIPAAFDLDALLAISLSESDRLAKQPALDGVKVILSSSRAEEAPAVETPANPEE